MLKFALNFLLFSIILHHSLYQHQLLRDSIGLQRSHFDISRLQQKKKKLYSPITLMVMCQIGISNNRMIPSYTLTVTLTMNLNIRNIFFFFLFIKVLLWRFLLKYFLVLVYIWQLCIFCVPFYYGCYFIIVLYCITV